MPILRHPSSGQVVDADEKDVKYFEDRGFELESAYGAVEREMNTRDDGGAIGALNVGARGFWSGLTFGGSDVLSAALSTEGERASISADREAHPIAGGIGEIAGVIAPTVLSGGATLPESAATLGAKSASLGAKALAYSPAGAMGRFAAEGVEASRAIGGVEGALKSYAYSGLEGSAQAAGSYISDTALGDRELTAEGLAGALGHGFAFGTAAGGVTHGVERGTIAVRRLFARADAKAAQVAEVDLAKTAQETLDAQEAAAEAARAQLEAARSARETADLQGKRAHADLVSVKNSLRNSEEEIAQGIPGHAELEAHLKDLGPKWQREGITQQMDAGALLERDIINDTAAKAADADDIERFRKAIAGGKSPGLVKLKVTPSGQAVLYDSRDMARLIAAKETGVPVKVNWQVGAEPHPMAESFTSGLATEAKAAREVEAMKAKIRANQVPDQPFTITKPDGTVVENFTNEGLDAAAKRQLSLEAKREAELANALKEYDAAKAEMEAVHRTVAENPSPARRGSTRQQVEQQVEFPAGFDPAAVVDGKPVFNANPTVKSGVPKFKDISRDTYHDVAYVVRPSELARNPKLRGISSGDDMLSDARTASLRDGMRGKGKLGAIEIDVSKDGHLFVADGNHRLFAAAAEGDIPVPVRFRPVDSDIRGMDKIGGDLKAALEPGAGARAAAKAEPAADFAQQVHDSIAKIGSGPTQRYGEEGVFISAVHDEMRQAGYRGSLDEFKRDLLKANREQKLNLVRADLVDSMPESAVSASEISDMGSDFHFIEDQGKGVLRSTPSSSPRPIASSSDLSPLERQLAATKQQLDDGAQLGTLSRQAQVSPRSPAQIERAYDDAIERANAATDVAEKQMHLREASALEDQLSAGARGRSVVDDIGDMAPVMTRYERAAARVTELAGTSAPEAAAAHAKAFRAAEADAERRMMDRTARAIDDSANPLTSPEGRLAKAKGAKDAADIEIAKAKVVEAEASIGARAAETEAKRARAAFEAAQPQPQESALSTLAGMPGAHAIPIIGPMLSRYAQGKLMAESAGRLIGRVPATKTARAAAFAVRVKNKISDAIDRSLGLIERTAPKARGGAVTTGEQVRQALERRAFDDGEPGAPKGSSTSKLAAVRIREVSTAASRPDLVSAQVRREMRDVDDPDLIAATEKHRIAMYQHLDDTAPKGPPPNPFTKREWEPSPAEAGRWSRRLEVANDPLAAFEALHQQCLTPEAADTLRTVWPKLFGMAQSQLLDRAGDLKHPVEYKQLLRNSLLFDLPLHDSLQPDNAFVLRGIWAPPAPAAPAGMPGAPPVPSIVGNSNLTALFQPDQSRRAMR